MRGIWQQTGAKVLVDQTARGTPIGSAAIMGAEGTFSTADVEQAIRYVATPNFTVRRAGETIIVSARDMSARCSCGQALDKNWKFCPACGKAAPAAEAAK